MPFVAKATAVPLAKAAARISLGATIAELRREGMLPPGRRLPQSIDRIVNTPYGAGGRVDGYEIRIAAVARGVSCLTTIQALAAAIPGIDALNGGVVGARTLQEHARRVRRDASST